MVRAFLRYFSYTFSEMCQRGTEGLQRKQTKLHRVLSTALQVGFPSENTSTECTSELRIPGCLFFRLQKNQYVLMMQWKDLPVLEILRQL